MQFDTFVKDVLNEQGVSSFEDGHVAFLTRHLQHALANALVRELPDERIHDLIDIIDGEAAPEHAVFAFFETHVDDLESVVQPVLLTFRDEVTVLVKQVDEAPTQPSFSDRLRKAKSDLLALQREAFALRMRAQTVYDKEHMKDILEGLAHGQI